tara:strand:+ start:1940 stop:2203 length:264 start_codon:yes stop_codon:yes gene_type:complete
VIEKDMVSESEVCKSVLDTMEGKPKNMFNITAYNVFDNNWRVNVWSTKPVESDYSIIQAKFIEYSYFINYNKQSRAIVSSCPKIEKI